MKGQLPVDAIVRERILANLIMYYRRDTKKNPD